MTEKRCTSLVPCDLGCQDNLMGAEYEGIPQLRQTSADPHHKRLKIHRLVKGGYMEFPGSHWMAAEDPKIRKIKSSKMWTEWSVNKTNGLQDETPKWYIHGYPHRRPGMSSGGTVATYYPAASACQCEVCPCSQTNPCTCCRHLPGSRAKPPKGFLIEYCVHEDRSRKNYTPPASPLCPRTRARNTTPTRSTC